MSLIAWYPLNGDTLDYSGNGNIATNVGATIDNLGKIGRCYNFDGIDDYIDTGLLGGMNIGNCELTISAWLNPTVLGDYMAFSTGQSGDNNNRIYVWTSANIWSVNIGNNASASGQVAVQNKWTHILVKIVRTTANIYINGVHVQTKEFLPFTTATALVLGKHGTISSYYRFNGKMNDVRIYDHALSDKEIKELAKAKILHYKFDEFEEPTVNVVIPNVAPTVASGLSADWLLTKLDADTFKIEALKDAPAVSTYGDISNNLTTTKSILANNPITISCEVVDFKGSLSRIYPSSGGFGPITGYYNDGKRHGRTIVHTLDWSHNIVFRVTNTAAILMGDYIIIKNIQMEEKDHMTPYINGSRGGIVKDSSGYRNDAVLDLANTPQWTKDSKKGLGAYYFKNKTISKTINTPENITMSILVRIDDINQTIHTPMCINGTQFEISIGSGRLWVGYEINGVRVANFSSDAILFDGKWHHLCSSFDGSKIKAYVDGVLVSTWDSVGTIYRGTRTLNIGSMAGTYLTNGGIDDVQIYATALSDADVLELYQTKASLDNTGNLFVSQVDEFTTLESSEVYNNLIVNGDISYESNLNFSALVYDATEKCLKLTSGASSSFTCDAIVPIGNNGLNVFDTYRVEMELKAQTIASKAYVFIMTLDKDNSYIEELFNYKTGAAKTTLAQNLNNGDTIVYLTSATGWWNNGQDIYNHEKSIMFFRDGIDFAPEYTYTRLYKTVTLVDTVNHTLKLQAPYAGSTIPAGTHVANVSSGGYIYPTNIVNTTLSLTNWIKGVATHNTFRHGTRSIKIGALINREAASYPCTTLIKGIKLYNLTNPQQVINVPLDLIKLDSSSLETEMINEVGIVDNILGWWKLNNDLIDYSGKGNNASIISVGTGLPPLIQENGATFRGTDTTNGGYINTGILLSGVYYVTYSFWLTKKAGVTTFNSEHILSAGDNDSNLYINKDAVKSTISYYQKGIETSVDITNDIDGEHHIVVTVDNRVRHSEVKIYVDGVLVKTQMFTTRLGETVTNPLVFGMDWDGASASDFLSNAILRDIKVFNKVLTLKEVQIEYNIGKNIQMSIDKNSVYLMGEINEI